MWWMHLGWTVTYMICQLSEVHVMHDAFGPMQWGGQSVKLPAHVARLEWTLVALIAVVLIKGIRWVELSGAPLKI